MEIEEYRKKLRKMQKDHELSMNELAVSFVTGNNTVKEGDIVEDHIGFVMVKRVITSLMNGRDHPEAVYEGLSLTKRKKPRADKSTRKVFQSNLIAN